VANQGGRAVLLQIAIGGAVIMIIAVLSRAVAVIEAGCHRDEGGPGSKSIEVHLADGQDSACALRPDPRASMLKTKVISIDSI
jgi:hypothetical protein